MATTLEAIPARTTGRSVEWTGEESGDGRNVGRTERLASVAGGGLLAAYGLKRGGLGGLLLVAGAAALVQRGITGHCSVYQALGVNTADDEHSGARESEGVQGGPVHLSVVTTVNRPADELYRFWRDPNNVPRFSKWIDSVRVDSPTRAHWTYHGPMGRSWEWDTEVTQETEGESFSWQSLAGSDVQTSGSVRFRPLGADGGTEVTYTVDFSPPLGVVGAAVANLFHAFPEEQARGDLQTFKQLMETGEIPAAGG